MDDIKVLVMDVDGTLTDGRVYIGESGEAMKAFNIKDGYGIANILPQNDIVPVIITGRKSNIVFNRAKELNIRHVYQGVSDKVQKLHELCSLLNCEMNQIAYIGDDLNDLPSMRIVGVCGCPNDAAKEVKEIADFVSIYCGGNGAVREFIEWLVTREKKL